MCWRIGGGCECRDDHFGREIRRRNAFSDDIKAIPLTYENPSLILALVCDHIDNSFPRRAELRIMSWCMVQWKLFEKSELSIVIAGDVRVRLYDALAADRCSDQSVRHKSHESNVKARLALHLAKGDGRRSSERLSVARSSFKMLLADVRTHRPALRASQNAVEFES